MTFLLIEDNAEFARWLVMGFRKLGQSIDAVLDGESGVSVARCGGYDAILVAWQLPGVDGLEATRALRAQATVSPVLLLGAPAELATDARTLCLEAGADDYLPKSAEFSELLTRIHALLKRNDSSELLTAGSIELNLTRKTATRSGRALELSPLEFRALRYFALHVDQVVTRNMLLENVWKMSFDPHTSMIESHISRLRSHVNKGFASDAIQTIRKLGYKLVSRP